MDHIEELRQEYLTNYYKQKIDKIDNKEEVLEHTKKIVQEIITELEAE